MTQEVYHILSRKGYPLTCRGTIKVKGKGDMVTYFLTGPSHDVIETHEPAGDVTTELTALTTVNEHQVIAENRL